MTEKTLSEIVGLSAIDLENYRQITLQRIARFDSQGRWGLLDAAECALKAVETEKTLRGDM